MKFEWPIRVYYEDTDAAGIVYYANYLKYMERARTERLRVLGYEQDDLMQNEKVVFAVRSVEADYLKPARFNEELLVSAEFTELKRASLLFHQQVKHLDGTVLCEGTIRIACLDSESMSPKKIPNEMIERIKNGF